MKKSDLKALTHHSVTVLGKLTSRESGWVEFVEEVEGLGTSFRSNEFKAYPAGTMLKLTFRVGKSHRQLLFHKPVGEVEEIHAEGTIEFESERQQTGDDFPEYVGSHYIPTGVRGMLSTVCKMVESGERVNVLFRGPSGYGKTSLYEALGEHLGYRVVMVNCAAIMDTEQWFGYQEARDGETIFIPTEFSDAVMEGRCIIVLDEANRIEPWLSNSLFPMLDHRRKTNVHGVNIEAGPSIVFGHTVNEGVKFAGTHVMDAAYLNRIDMVYEVGAMPQVEEVKLLTTRYPNVSKAIAVEIVGKATELRSTIERQGLDIDASTRTTLKVARLCGYGMTIREAYDYVLVNAVSVDDRKAIIDILQRDGVSVKPFQVSSDPICPEHLSEEQWQEIINHVRAGEKINAVKSYRKYTMLGLKEAKEFVESIYDRLRS